MKPFLTNFVSIPEEASLVIKWSYDNELDLNVTEGNEVSNDFVFGTQTVTKVKQESSDSDFNEHEKYFLGTQTKTGNIEKTDRDVTEDVPYYFGTVTRTDDRLERSDTDYHSDIDNGIC